MKKVIFIAMLLCLFFINNATAKEMVTLSKCVDGDTAWFIYNGNKEKFRFLAIDTPESTTEVEPYGKEASEFTCNQLTNASKIEIEFDDNSTKTDKYDRYLAWIYVDGELLQKKLLKEGLAEVEYIYGDYKYLDEIKIIQDEAKDNKLGIWSNSNDENINSFYIGLIIIIVIILYITNKKYRNKINRKLKKDIRKKIQEL